MNLEEFLYNLQFDIEKVKPPDVDVDWDDAPLPYKIYRGLPVFPLSSEVPLSLEGVSEPKEPDVRQIGHFLWYVYGLTQLAQSAVPLYSLKPALGIMHTLRRFVPSGGALYPSELYVYLKVEDLPFGMYHYDAAHHRLVLVREGNFDAYLARALGNRCDVSACFGAVFVSTMFWKNFFKYHNFAYRLQGLDAGVLIGQLLEVSKRFGFETGVYFRFLDQAVNHLLGLSEQEESVYAVIPLSIKPPAAWFANRDGEAGKQVAAEQLCRELSPIAPRHYVRSRRVKEYPMLIKLNKASFLEAIGPVQWTAERSENDSGSQMAPLPRVDRLTYDLASVSQKRCSPGDDFVFGQVDPSQLATLLHEATASFSYRSDLDEASKQPRQRVSLYGCLFGVEDIPHGAYQYDSAAHALRPLLPGDQRDLLHEGMSMFGVNLFQVPMCLHVAGNRDFLLPALGYRGYRILQMEAGMLVQRLLLAASAIGLGGHPLLDFHTQTCDEIYKLAAFEKTSLIQIPVGHYCLRTRLQGGLHS
ncbi:SagB family peptide dehydrogenase [Brevibacillus sp. B_LB10_24]|uniref:SagB family peptide dehydrogenase n=1 Tax=Brevibacillus sp. B_LB10_24 TaxID=3380645 RepID=UPI0038BBFAC2